MWFATIDLTKPFDRVEYDPVFETYCGMAFPNRIVRFLRAFFNNRLVVFTKGEEIAIQKGMKQGDVINPIPFNAVLESTRPKWKLTLRHHGINIGADEPRTNTRYADDFLLCAQSCGDLVYMFVVLIVEVAVELPWNPEPKSSLPLTGLMLATWKLVVLWWKCCVVQTRTSIYIGNFLMGNLKGRSETEPEHRLQVVWAKFHKHQHKHVLTNHHVSWKIFFSMQLFSGCVVWFGLVS